MKKFPAVVICGIAAMVLTIILYFTILGNVILAAIHFISLVAILIAEGITTFYAAQIGGSPRRLAATVVSAVMIPVSLLLSAVYIVNFPEGYGSYMGWYLSGTLIVNILAYVLMHFDTKRTAENDRFQHARDNMMAMRKRVRCIMADPAAKPYAQKLRALEEKLHFTNDAVIVAEDETIARMLMKLQSNIANPEFDTNQLLTELEQTIDMRDIMTKRSV